MGAPWMDAVSDNPLDMNLVPSMKRKKGKKREAAAGEEECTGARMRRLTDACASVCQSGRQLGSDCNFKLSGSQPCQNVELDQTFSEPPNTRSWPPDSQHCNMIRQATLNTETVPAAVLLLVP